jgi:hypothetical protein
MLVLTMIKNDEQLLEEFETAKASGNTKDFLKVIRKIESIDLFERYIRIISHCCGAFPYPNLQTGKGKCDNCDKVCELDAMNFY